jgi:hypothetical protein
MKHLRQYIRQILRETCPESNGWTQYYEVEPQENIAIHEIIDCWVNNGGKIYDHSMPVMIKTQDLAGYREYQSSELRNPRESQKYIELKDDIEQNGIQEHLVLIVGKDGYARIGEGNHRHDIATELQILELPVWIEFWQSAK